MASEIDEIRALVTEAENDWWCPACDAFADATAAERCTVCESQLGEHTTAHAKALLAAYDALAKRADEALREAAEARARAEQAEWERDALAQLAKRRHQ